MAHLSPLISIAELAGALQAGQPPVVLDVRWALDGPPAADLYRAGHLPGAVFVDLDRDLAGEPGTRGRHPLPEPAALQATLRRWGVRTTSTVVAYDAGNGTIAARAWWLLRWAGVEQARVLDGGLAGWVAAGRELSTARPAPLPGDVVVRPGGMPVLDATEAARVAHEGVLLDARSGERYRGEVEPIDPVAGHVPGARSAPATENVGADGCFLSAEALRPRFARLGVPVPPHPSGGTPVGTYCGSGVTAAQQVLALSLAGVDAALYVGSWSEWVSVADRPVAVGPDLG